MDQSEPHILGQKERGGGAITALRGDFLNWYNSDLNLPDVSN